MRVVVIGSGLAGATVAEALAKEPGYHVDLVTAETHGYYARPRLSHAFSTDASPVMKSFEALAPVRVLAGVQVHRIDRERQRIEVQDGKPLDYETLVLATGSAARGRAGRSSAAA
jgi:NAD(P)H-nitrite reductase large subunit